MTTQTSTLDAPPPAATDTARAGRRSRRATVVRWVRDTHGWFGLWGATLGLLFGISGIWLNHRAVLKLPPVAQQRSESQIVLPDPAPADAQALAVWLQTALQLNAPATVVRTEPARPVPWAERAPRADRKAAGDSTPAGTSPRLMQPERWMVNFGGPQATIQAEAWAGNRSVSVRRVDNGLIGTLTNLHKGINMPIGWILLVDSLAGSLILLSVSGLILWVMTHRRRVVGLTIFAVGLAATAGLALSRI